MLDTMLKDSGFWSKPGKNSDIIISSRVALLRNHADFFFPEKNSLKSSEEINNIASDFCKNFDGNGFDFYNLQQLTEDERNLLKERSIISPSMADNQRTALCNSNVDESLQLLVNDKEHFKIQANSSGFNFKAIYDRVDEVDNRLNSIVPYAYSSKYGYLTSSIETVGTGLKVSALLHLPSLNSLKTLASAKEVIEEMGAEINPLLKGQNRAFGSLYIVSNRCTIGISEDEIIMNMENVISLLVELESEAREDYIYDSNYKMEDRIWRSYGLLKYARNITYFEAVEYLSNLRLGVILSYFSDFTIFDINDLMVTIQDNHLKNIYRKQLLNLDELDDYRASYLRSKMIGE